MGRVSDFLDGRSRRGCFLSRLVGTDVVLHARSSSTLMKYAFATSYADQQMAVLGAAVTTRAFIPRKNPFEPSLLQIIPAALDRPLACLISGSDDVPRVCNRVLITSRGVVAAAANPPANPPAVQCVSGS